MRQRPPAERCRCSDKQSCPNGHRPTCNFCLQRVQLHIHAVEFDYLCQDVESATVMLGNPGGAQLPVDRLVLGPQKWLRSGHFLARQTGSGAAENLMLPLYRIVVQHLENQILTEVTGNV